MSQSTPLKASDWHSIRNVYIQLAAVLCCVLFSSDAFGQAGRNSNTGLFEFVSPRLKIISDIPIDAELSSWPSLLDQAINHWKEFFGVPTMDSDKFSATVYVIRDLNNFQRHGLLDGVPAFDEGYQFGDRLFLREQPSIYYRRHLFLHEATHWIMWHIYGGCGSPWYMEGMADMQGTHSLGDGVKGNDSLGNGRLRLGIIPGSPLQVPYWGRLKKIHETMEEGTAPSLAQILAYENDRDRTIRYSWSWAACVFFANHPKFGPILHQVRGNKMDYSDSLSRRLRASIGNAWEEACIDWNGFISDLEFGYDPQRSMVLSGEPTSAKPFKANTSFALATDHGWQPTGIQVDAGQSIRIVCSGRYRIRDNATAGQVLSDRDWESEPQGITIEYFRGLPLGCVVATIQSAAGNQSTHRWEPIRIGRDATIDSKSSGVLYLKINEPSGRLSDNSGRIDVKIMIPK
ncbi:MAG: hypothetical protein ABL921_30850 [Pirellula sp.]